MSKRKLIGVRITLVLAALSLFAIAQPAVSVAGGPLCLTRIQLAPDVVTSFGIIRGPDENIWVFEETTGGYSYRLAKITPNFDVSEFPIPGVFGPLHPSMTVGPDGNIWYTRPDIGALSKVTIAGPVTTFPLPAQSTSPYGIVVGPDGNLWVTEIAIHQILKVGTDGTVLDQFSVPTTGPYPSRIIRGPDNNLWFLQDNQKIGRMTTAGVLTEFSFPTYVSDLVAGPDGNVWYGRDKGDPFPYDYAGYYGKITPSGAITEFGPFSLDLFMTFGSDGNLWGIFELRFSWGIGRLTPTGSWDGFYALMPPATSTDTYGGLTSGADGRIWLSGWLGTVATFNPQHPDCYYGYLPATNK